MTNLYTLKNLIPFGPAVWPAKANPANPQRMRLQRPPETPKI